MLNLIVALDKSGVIGVDGRLPWKLSNDLKKIGVVNQTTMLASETKKIIEIFKQAYSDIHGKENEYVANTRDTLCYATNENQDSTLNLLQQKVDLSIIVGGYNSSNTSHLVELSSKKFQTFFINSETNISQDNIIKHFDLKTKQMISTNNFLPKKKCKIILTSGASCPDVILEKVMQRIAQIKKQNLNQDKIIHNLEIKYSI